MCLTPIYVKQKPGGVVPLGNFALHSVPCGKCAQCKLRRVQSWVFRLRQEMKQHDSAWFVTLTYKNPIITPNGFMTLSRPYKNEKGQYVNSDLQRFFKRMRDLCSTPIKYYACGEYGSETQRPHYHIILFGADPEHVEQAWCIDNEPIGYCHFGQVNADSIAYCAKYICKDKKIPMFEGDDRKKEFSVMSKNLGENYLTEQVRLWHDENQHSYVVDNGFKQPLPRYYRDKIFNDVTKEQMNFRNYSRYEAKSVAKLNDYGYNPSLPYDHPDNANAVSAYYRAMHYAIIETNRIFLETTKRDKI